MEMTGNRCTECGGNTYLIRIVDRGIKNAMFKMSYATKDKKSRLGASYDLVGDIDAEMCENCQRIALRGVPRK